VFGIRQALLQENPLGQGGKPLTVRGIAALEGGKRLSFKPRI
jgi:hypothetical protein